MIIDTHAHLDFPDYQNDLNDVLRRAGETGVKYIVNVATSLTTSEKAITLAEDNENISATVGIHPHDAKDITEGNWTRLKELASSSEVVAIGETGLDYYRDLSPREIQQHAFRRHIQIAKDLDLPLIVHCRDASEDCLDILSESSGTLKGVMHCFSGDHSVAARCLELGLYISFAGQITFPKAENLRQVAKSVPVERLLLETDSPFLAPQPKRGKRNEPAYLKYTLETLAQIYDLSCDDVARVTTLNAYNLFGIGDQGPKSKIVYLTRNSLYLNITNRCSNNCTFCIRQATPFVKGHHLKLEREPTAEEIIAAIGDPRPYDEVVFCGYGEPTVRLDVVKAVGKWLKENGAAAVRLTTNGQGDLINGRSICEELRDIIDRVCVSLNSGIADQYHKICRSQFGTDAYPALLAFISKARDTFHNVEVTAVDMPGIDIEKCRELAAKLGVRFRLRKYNEVG